MSCLGQNTSMWEYPQRSSVSFHSISFLFSSYFFLGGGQAISVAFLEYVFNSLGIGTEVEFENK